MLEWLREVRNDLHMHPEIGFEEVRTTAKIKEILTELGVEVIELPGLPTGCVGLIKGAEEGKVLGLRADIDALPLQELNDVPYKSTNDGRMHACGHDGHTTMMLGVAKKIMETGLNKTMKGTAKFIFQPAEELVNGAGKMIEYGVLENPKMDRIIAGHMSADLPVGKIGWFRGVSHASADVLKLHITGYGAHGARPEASKDPVAAAAYFVTAVQTVVSRSISPMESGVVTIGMLNTGTAPNIIPEEADIKGTIRSLSNDVRETIFQRLREIAQGLEVMFNVKADLVLEAGAPPCYNDYEVSQFVDQAAQTALGPDSTVEVFPSMGGEDFALFTEKVPGAMVRVGCVDKEALGKVYPLHSPYFDLTPESLDAGVKVFYQAVKDYLK